MKLFSKVLKSVVNFDHYPYIFLLNDHYSYKTKELERETMDAISIVNFNSKLFFFFGEKIASKCKNNIELFLLIKLVYNQELNSVVLPDFPKYENLKSNPSPTYIWQGEYIYNQ